MSNSKITPGTMFVYDPRNAYALSKDDPGYSTNPHGKPCREIQLETYPSSRDFIDPINSVRPGDIGIILREIGIPHMLWGIKKLWNDPELSQKYTVYEVIIKKEQAQIFGSDMMFLKASVEETK